MCEFICQRPKSYASISIEPSTSPTQLTDIPEEPEKPYVSSPFPRIIRASFSESIPRLSVRMEAPSHHTPISSWSRTDISLTKEVQVTGVTATSPSRANFSSLDNKVHGWALMTSSSLLPRESVCLSNSDTSDSSTGDPNQLNQSQSAFSQIDDTVSITVQKTFPTQKSGLSLVHRKKHVYVSDVPVNSLFHGTELQVGDKILLVNGKRPKQVEGTKHVRRLIAKAKATVTMVVKRSTRRPQRGAISLSPMAQRKKRRAGKNPRNVVAAATENQTDNQSLTLNLESEPGIISKGELAIDKELPQITITTNKTSPDQEIGLQLKDVDKMILVNAIAPDSIFNNTRLEIGDRIIGVMGIDCKSNGDSQQALEIMTKSQIEVTLVIEKTQTSTGTTKNGDTIQDKGVLGMSEHSDRYISPSRKIMSENSSSEDEKAKGTSDHIEVSVSEAIKKKKVNPERKIIRKIKAVGPPKNTTPKTTPKQLKESKGSESNHSNSSRVRRLSSREDNDSEASSQLDIATEEQQAQATGRRSLSKSPISRKQNLVPNPGKDLSFDYENFSGDYIKVTVRKDSDTRSGFVFEKFDGKIILAAVPQHEKRIFPGLQVLAINGVPNIQSVSRAEELVSSTTMEVRLVINFSSPLKATFKCPCCLRPLTADGKHTQNGQSRRIVRRKLPAQSPTSPTPAQPQQSNPDTEMMSVAASEITTKVTNRAPPGKRLPPRIERPPKYHFDEFDSDSDEDGRK